MNKSSIEYQTAVKLGESLVGKTAQSRILTEISTNGKQILSPSQKITGFEIVECGMEPTVMVIISDTCVFEDFLINIK